MGTRGWNGRSTLGHAANRRRDVDPPRKSSCPRGRRARRPGRRLRGEARAVEKDVASLTYTATPAPRLYYLDFDLVVTTGHEGDLLDLQEPVARFHQQQRVLTIAVAARRTRTPALQGARW